MTAIADLLAQAAAKLSEISDSPRLDAEVLLALATGKTRAHFRAWPEKHPAAEEEAVFLSFLESRLRGRPIAHITGVREFWSREFLVGPEVLIPRPETELLVELALERIPKDLPARIADLGTGSGAIAITLGLERPQASVTALDLSPEALALAQQNAARLGAENVQFCLSDWFAALPDGERFDLVVGNPPYIAEDDPHLAQGDVRFEPLLALASGPDGLSAIRRIVQQAPHWLNPGGWLLLEHGYDQAEAVRTLLSAAGLAQVGSFADLQGHLRVSAGVQTRSGVQALAWPILAAMSCWFWASSAAARP